MIEPCGLRWSAIRLFWMPGFQLGGQQYLGHRISIYGDLPSYGEHSMNSAKDW